jgi:hypothetical protein
MMEIPRSPDPSPNFDTRHGPVSVQGSSSNLIAFWHFAPWPTNTEYRSLHPVSKIDTLVRKFAVA